ncbi:hypothetical protein KM043_018020 [Ampulex compressa]|nr:hypothetical protein KM043_018020 [Ampulex compressa]
MRKVRRRAVIAEATGKPGDSGWGSKEGGGRRRERGEKERGEPSLRRDESEEKRRVPPRQRRRDQWTCAGVPRHHGDLLATSRNKMATTTPGTAERWRQDHLPMVTIVLAVPWTSEEASVDLRPSVITPTDSEGFLGFWTFATAQCESGACQPLAGRIVCHGGDEDESQRELLLS